MTTERPLTPEEEAIFRADLFYGSRTMIRRLLATLDLARSPRPHKVIADWSVTGAYRTFCTCECPNARTDASMSEDPEVVGSTPTADRPLAGATALDTRPQTISLLRRLVAVVDAATMVWRDPVPADAVPALHDAKVDLASLGVEPDLETERTR